MTISETRNAIKRLIEFAESEDMLKQETELLRRYFKFD